jgi:cell division septation protein DedD
LHIKMSNGFFSSNRPQRESESRMSNERSRDFGGAKSQAPDQGGPERRDPGADALLELARLIGQNDALPPEASKSETRLGDISRTAATQADAARNSLAERASGRREPDFGEPRVPVAYPGDEPSRTSRGSAGFGFPSAFGRDDYAAAPGRAASDERGYDRGDRRNVGRDGRGRPDYGPPDDIHGEYADGDDGEPDDFDENEPGERRRPTRVIMAVLGLAVFGSAAAYGYRTMISTGSSGPTPIIRADNSPTKITPMSDVRPESGRIGDRIGEQLVRRDEDPVDVKTSSGTRGIDASGQPDIMPASASPGDPRRVHTVPIRADQGAASSSSDRAASRSGAPPVQSAPPAPRQVAAVPPVPPPQPSPPPQRQAALAPAAPPPPDTVPVDSGGYVVQLTAQRSEADAQTSFRSLQVKYPVLSGRQPLIRRKDQGERGIFFAAQIGPFGAKTDADQLCDQLKSAGGSCFVQRN